MLLLIRGPNIRKRKVGDDKMYYTDIDCFFFEYNIFWTGTKSKKTCC